MDYQRIAVLGSNSFSGSHFVATALASSSADVMGISRSPEYHPAFLPYRALDIAKKRFRFIQADININRDLMFSVLDEFKPELIVNYAGQGEVRNSWKWPDQWFQTNCMGIVHLASWLRSKTWLKRYIAISTPEVYGTMAAEMKESNSSFSPSTPYAASKLAGDLFLLTLLKEGTLPATFVRSANVYGPHQQLFRIIPRTILSIRSGEKLHLHGGGVGKRAFLHIRDACACTWKAATIGRVGEVYHQAPVGDVIAIRDVVERICVRLGKEFSDCVIVEKENYGQDAMYSLNADKARKELGWSSEISLDDGIDEVVRWIDDNWEILKDLPRDYVHAR